MIDQKKIALIHIIKKKLGLSDPAYRKLLHDAVGVTTSKDLDAQKFRALMKVFVRSKHYRENSQGITLKQRLFIEHLVEEIGWDQEHFKNFLVKYYHKSALQSFSKTEASKVISSIKNIQARK